MRHFAILALAAALSSGFARAQDAVTPRPSPTPADEAAHERVVVSTTPLGGDLFEQTQSVTVLSG